MIHTRRFGAPGGVPTVMAHCFMGHSGPWGPMAEAITPTLDALAFDMPGHGRSPMPDRVEDLQTQVVSLIDGMVAKPSLLIGHSFGGVAMLRFALHNPARVLGLVMIEPVFIAAASLDPAYTPEEGESRYLDLAGEGRFEDAAREFFTYNDPTRDWMSLPEAARTMMANQMRLLPANQPGAASDPGQLLVPGLMEGFAPPVLLIGGARSPALFPAIIRTLSKRLPTAESVMIEGAGHMVPMTHATQTADHISRWMRKNRVPPVA